MGNGLHPIEWENGLLRESERRKSTQIGKGEGNTFNAERCNSKKHDQGFKKCKTMKTIKGHKYSLQPKGYGNRTATTGVVALWT
eukprot:scaffold2000_cov48-Attheya_sp.AAC.7